MKPKPTHATHRDIGNGRCELCYACTKRRLRQPCRAGEFARVCFDCDHQYEPVEPGAFLHFCKKCGHAACISVFTPKLSPSFTSSGVIIMSTGGFQ